MAVDCPLVIMPSGWTPESREWRGWDRQGNPIKFVTYTDQRTGRTAGNDRGPTIQRWAADGHSDTKVRPEPVTTTLHASDMGMRTKELVEFQRWMDEHLPKRRPVFKSRLIWPPEGMEA